MHDWWERRTLGFRCWNSYVLLKQMNRCLQRSQMYLPQTRTYIPPRIGPLAHCVWVWERSDRICDCLIFVIIKASFCSLSSWLSIIFQLGLSLLDLSDGLEFFKSADSFSEGLVHLLFAIYLIMAMVLLINMLIALLSNTYQRVQVCIRLFLLSW